MRLPPEVGAPSRFRSDDLTTGQIGWMQASAANGFANTSIDNCSGTPFNFQPEFSTAAKSNIIPWAALQTNISTEFEIGHFEPCTSVTDPGTVTFADGISDTFWNECHGPYETEDDSQNGRLSRPMLSATQPVTHTGSSTPHRTR